MNILRPVFHTLFWIAVALALVAAAVSTSAAANLGRQGATFGGIGAGVTIGSLPVFFDNYQVGSDAVQGEPAPVPAP